MNFSISFDDFTMPFISIPILFITLSGVIVFSVYGIKMKKELSYLAFSLSAALSITFIMTLIISFSPINKLVEGDQEAYEQHFTDTETLISSEIADEKNFFFYYENGNRVREKIENIEGIKTYEVKTNQETYLVDMTYDEDDKPEIQNYIQTAPN